ncbi:hypothetical protein LVJ94_45835 [Pendulispora rubella]|uniref:Uncharacterized protein n=1 Tax=Pendulispora rubella TaxID=2741070 RepID=A0ABZ2L3S5_9BACT
MFPSVRWPLLAAALVAISGSGAASGAVPGSDKPLPSAQGWHDAGWRGARGITIGPIENGYHPGKGYGSEPYERTLAECQRAGAEWIAITPFGRTADLSGRGIDPTFEMPFEENRAAVRRGIEMAHERGLKVMLVPHIWVESGGWRAEIDPKTDAGWDAWAKSYGDFVRTWAKLAEETGVEMLSAGVELRSWVTTARAPSFGAIVRDLRRIYHGTLTYSANWDDVDRTVILGDLDVIGINAFYPLAQRDGDGYAAQLEGARKVRDKVHALAETWHKPVLFTEIGYTTRPDPAVRPWEWPDTMAHVKVDEDAQALAYHALLAPLLDEPDFAGFFVWRYYADPEDVSQEAEWGFSPRGKVAELVMRDAFAAPWAADPVRAEPFGTRHARTPGVWDK